jgi:hypothetical protein
VTPRTRLLRRFVPGTASPARRQIDLGLVEAGAEEQLELFGAA